MARVVVGSNPVASLAGQFGVAYDAEAYRHRITATVGFDTASFDLRDRKDALEEFFYNGLGRHVVRYGPDGQFTAWEGQIVEMTLTVPGMRATISLSAMYNRVAVRYTELDTGSNPPGETADTTTADADDTDSQDRYGIKQLVFRPPKASKLTQTDAEQLRDTMLSEYKQPRRSADIVSSMSEPRLRVKCQGYGHTLGWRVYNYTAASGTDDADDEIADINTSVGQFIASTDLDANTLQVAQYTNEDLTALEQIQAIASLGDASDNRWLAYVLEDRKLYYKPASTTVKYWRRMADNRQEIRDQSGRVIPPWELRPNNWIRTTDVYPFGLAPANLQDDYQAMFIESVEWQEPDTLLLAGSRGDAMQGVIARAANKGDVLL
ncbi:MAG: hypothetical protein ACE5F8_05125 [Woeseiaceae bacterium]